MINEHPILFLMAIGTTAALLGTFAPLLNPVNRYKDRAEIARLKAARRHWKAQ